MSSVALSHRRLILALFLGALAIALLLFAAPGVLAQPEEMPAGAAQVGDATLILPVRQDTTIGSQGDAPWGSETTLYASQGNGGVNPWWALYEFDLSLLPPGTRILSAQAHFYTLWSNHSALSLHRITQPWDEHADSWSTLVGGVEEAALQTLIPAAAGEETIIDITTLAQHWAQGELPGHGIVFKPAVYLADTRLASKESVDPARWPYLVVTFDPDEVPSFADDFDPNTGFSGNDGANTWTGSWTEQGEGDGPAAGRVRVGAFGPCRSGACLRVGANKAEITGFGASRQADLGQASWAVFSYHLKRTGKGGSLLAQVSNDGGATWTTLATHVIDGNEANWGFYVHDISAYLATFTQIRFVGDGSTQVPDTYAFVDDVQILFTGQGVAGRVWEDLDRSGAYDLGEPGLAGVRMRLYAGACATQSDLPIAIGLTNAAGIYRFSEIAPGDYCVLVDAATTPAGQGIISGQSPRDVTLPAHGFVTGLDLGYASAYADARLTAGLYSPCPDVSWLHALAQSYGGAITQADHSACVFSVESAASQQAALQQAIVADARTRYAQPDVAMQGMFTPNDPLYSNPSYVYGPQQINAGAAWDLTTGDPTLIVAVIDSGIDAAHPEFTGRILPGWDFVNNDADPFDDNGHGTHVSGIVAAGLNNGIGIAGLANVRILPVKVLNADNSGWWSNVAAGITWAVDQGARVLNLSLTGSIDSPALRDAVAYAVSKGAVVVVAAGNSGSEKPHYPASYEEVISLAATTSTGIRWTLSNYGPNVDVMAPGATVYSTKAGGDYRFMSGTSMASPHAAGVAALILSQNPNLTPAEVKNLLQETAMDLGDPGLDALHGWGLIDAGAAVASAIPQVFLPPSTAFEVELVGDLADDGLIDPGDTLRYRIVAANNNATPLAAVLISSTIPAQTTYVTGSTRLNGIPVQENAAPASPFPLDEGGLNIGSVPAHNSSVVTFDVVVQTPPRGVYQVLNKATVQSELGGEEMSVTSEIAGTLLALAVDKAQAQPGDILTYTLTSDYLGPELWQAVTITAPIPAGASFVAGSANAGGSAAGGALSWSLGSNAAATPAFQAPQPFSGILTLAPTADAFIDNAQPNSNFGGADQIQVLRSGGHLQHALLRFDISSIPASLQVISATLELDLLAGSDAGAVQIELLDSSADWAEASVTWNSFGSGAGSLIGSAEVAGAGLYRWDVTALARAWHAGAQANQGLVLRTSNASSSGIQKLFAAREHANAGLRPRLKLFYATETDVAVAADAFISEAQPNSNFGAASTITVDSLGASRTWGLARFDVSALPGSSALLQARLLLDAVSPTTSGAIPVSVYAAAASWQEGGVTWNGFGGSSGRGALQATTTVNGNGPYAWDVTALARAWLDDPQANQGIVLSHTSNNSPVYFASKEHTLITARPRLRLVYALPGPSLGSALAAAPGLVAAGNEITVTMTLTVSAAAANVTPSLAFTPTNGLSASLIAGPTPATAPVDADGTTFTWVYQAASSGQIGQITFSGAATNGVLTWPAASSNSVIVHPPLQFQAQIADPADFTDIRAGAFIADAAAALPAHASNSVTTRLLGSIGGRLWNDADGDRIQDAAEPGIAGGVVTLRQNGLVIASAVTAADGAYFFSDLDAGAYTLALETASLPPQFALLTTPHPQTVTLGPGGDAAAYFGIKARSISVGDTIWYDANGNGRQDAGEPGLGNVTLRLWLDDGDGAFEPDSGLGSDELAATAVSNAAGAYRLDAPVAGVYFVQVTDAYGILAGLAHTIGLHSISNPSPPISVSLGQAYQDADFGFVKVPPADHGVIGDQVWIDANGDGLRQAAEAAAIGVQVCATPGEGDPQCTLTDLNGRYLLGLPAGTYSVAVATPPLGLTSTTPASLNVILAAGQQILSLDFGYWQGGAPMGRIGGHIWQDLVVGGEADGIFDPDAEPGLPNVSVDLILDLNGDTLWDAGEPYVATITTWDGDFRFDGLLGGNYLVRASDTYHVLRNYTPVAASLIASAPLDGVSKPQPYAVPLALGETNNTADFGYREYEVFGAGESPEPGMIGDLVWEDVDGDGAFTAGLDLPQPGVTLLLRSLEGGPDRMATTGLDGRYLFSDVPLGAYEVEVTDLFGVLGGYLPTNPGPDTHSQPYALFLGLQASDMSADFGYARPVQLGGVIYFDYNGNGLRDGAESMTINAVPIHLRHVGTGQEWTRLSDDSGFSLTGVTPGVYAITAPAALPGLVLTSVSPVTQTLMGGQAAMGLDFGYIAPTGATLAAFEAAISGDLVLLRWSVHAQSDLDGFVVWRSAAAEGPYKPVSGLIPFRADGLYSWKDTDLVAGHAWWYKLESRPDGVFFGPISLPADPAGGQQLFAPLILR